MLMPLPTPLIPKKNNPPPDMKNPPKLAASGDLCNNFIAC
jgi:hypothetical protein